MAPKKFIEQPLQYVVVMQHIFLQQYLYLGKKDKKTLTQKQGPVWYCTYFVN